MDKNYQPNQIEQKWYQTWEQHHYFSPEKSPTSYCIVIPPPNVTGSLHMGHGFQATLMDILIRYHRMQGDCTLWQPGTDHAGIATQMVVEKRLSLNNQSRHDLGREKFVEKIWQWKDESGGNITRQFRRLGASVDWTRERFTMDEDFTKAVREVFIKLYEEGLIYKGTKLVNWDPKLLTAISDLEVLNVEEEGFLWHIRYPLTEGNEYLTVATTRPETLLGDTAVAVHPDDERYRHLIGKEIKLPLTIRTIPIIADDSVDPSFGSGAVKITPAHDFNDYAMGQRHQLPIINIFTPDAHLNNNVPTDYQGLERFAARKKVIEDLETQGLLEKCEKHLLKIPRGEKSDAIIEPYLTQQWFMKMKPLAAPAIDAVQQGKVKFIPENWSKTYFQWLNNIEDWCISRQLWWGHRIPVWYDETGKMYVGHNESDVRTRYQLTSFLPLTQDDNVLDTWFSASLWPFATLGWPNTHNDLSPFYPTNVLVTGFDIIFFWVARMIMMGLKFIGEVPFKEVFITGLIRDAEGQKMSKSKGNVLDPLDLIDGIGIEELVKKRIYGLMQPKMAEKIEKNTRQEFTNGIAAFGTDALRFTFCSLASFNREIRFDVKRLEGNRNFCNKLWNAARYILINTEGKDLSIEEKKHVLSLADRFILSRLQQTIEMVHEAIHQYRFDLLAHTLYEFTWNELCDWYLELSKPILTSPESSADALAGTRYTLVTVFEQLLRLLHPIMPFITEEIWQQIAPLIGISAKTIMLQPYPTVNSALKDEESQTEIEWLKTIIINIRTLRSEMNIPPGKELSVFFTKGTPQDKMYFNKNKSLIIKLAKLAKIEWIDEAIANVLTALAGELEILIPMEGLVDKKEEITRLTKEMTKLEKEIEFITHKLNNPQFIDKAPLSVVEKEKTKLTELTMMREKLKKQWAQISSSISIS